MVLLYWMHEGRLLYIIIIEVIFSGEKKKNWIEIFEEMRIWSYLLTFLLKIGNYQHSLRYLGRKTFIVLTNIKFFLYYLPKWNHIWFPWFNPCIFHTVQKKTSTFHIYDRSAFNLSINSLNQSKSGYNWKITNYKQTRKLETPKILKLKP